MYFIIMTSNVIQFYVQGLKIRLKFSRICLLYIHLILRPVERPVSTDFLVVFLNLKYQKTETALSRTLQIPRPQSGLHFVQFSPVSHFLPETGPWNTTSSPMAGFWSLKSTWSQQITWSCGYLFIFSSCSWRLRLRLRLSSSLHSSHTWGKGRTRETAVVATTAAEAQDVKVSSLRFFFFFLFFT